MRVVWLELTIFKRGVSVRVGLVDKVAIDAYAHKTSGKKVVYIFVPRDSECHIVIMTGTFLTFNNLAIANL